jgi:citrate lyase beta subunit
LHDVAQLGIRYHSALEIWGKPLQTTIDPDSLSPLMQQLAEANRAFVSRFPGASDLRQPVHTLYGGAHLYRSGAAAKITGLAAHHFAHYAPDAIRFAENLGISSEPELAAAAFERVGRKLATEAIEDHRIDFEDGYGTRTDAEEDMHVDSAATAMAEGLLVAELPAGVGIRIKALTEEAKARSLRTLDLFISKLVVAAAGQFPEVFYVTLPKVTSVTQVEVICAAIELLEQRTGIQPGSIRVELMLENVQMLFNESGQFGLRHLVEAGQGRVTTFVLGTFDYTASCNVAASFQSHTHAAADFARQMLIAGLTGTGVNVCDGITNIMPIPPHKGADLSETEQEENRAVVASAWQLHFDNILHSMRLGIYQGWDLNPAQIPIRFAAVSYFYLQGLSEAQARLNTFIDKAAQASMSGNTFDDAATGQGLVNFFVNGIQCGALTEAEVLASGLNLAELQTRSFVEIVAGRTQPL